MDMPLTNAEKQKRYRQRLIEKHGADAVKNKDKAQKKQKQEENLTASREKERLGNRNIEQAKLAKFQNHLPSNLKLH